MRNRQACSLHECGKKFSNALMQREAHTVLSVTSTPGSRNMRIRRCVNSQLKKRRRFVCVFGVFANYFIVALALSRVMTMPFFFATSLTCETSLDA